MSLSIIGGKYKGYPIVKPKAKMRPTFARLRKCVGSILYPYISGVHVLDLFSGSGAIAFELMSRGAGYISMVDNQRAAITAMQSTAERLRIGHAVSIIYSPANLYIENTKDTFDLIYVDPPYAFSQKLLDRILAAVPRVLTANGLLVVENPRQLSVDPCLHLLLERSVGQTRLSVYQLIVGEQL